MNTSKLAWEEIKNSNKQLTIQQQIVAFMRKSGKELTANEIADHVCFFGCATNEKESVRKRVNELAGNGGPLDIDGTKTCTITGKKAKKYYYVGLPFEKP